MPANPLHLWMESAVGQRQRQRVVLLGYIFFLFFFICAKYAACLPYSVQGPFAWRRGLLAVATHFHIAFCRLIIILRGVREESSKESEGEVRVRFSPGHSSVSKPAHTHSHTLARLMRVAHIL